jgi:hypothetical protein
MMKTKEIGSEFWDAEISGAFSTNRKTYLSGRTALAAIISDLKSRGARRVCLPDYCCESMIEPFLRQGMQICFYPVQQNETSLTFSLEKVENCDAVLLVNYFGFMDSETKASMRKCREAGKSVILDLTHAVFFDDEEYCADYIFGSYRKWTGVEAGFSSGKRQPQLESWRLNETGSKYLMLRQEARQIKYEFVTGGYSDEDMRRKQLSLFEKAEELLDKEYLSDTDEKNKARIRSLDTDYIRDKRRNNAKTLYAFSSQLKLCRLMFSALSDNVIPLTVPILVTEGRRDSLRTFLRERGVFCPVHWPLTSLHKAEKGALELYREELSLICDQRYDVSDMARMMEMVKKWEMTTSVR